MSEAVPLPIPPGRGELDQLQRFLLRVVTHRDGVDAGVEAATREGLLPSGASTLAEVFPGNARLSPHEQLHIYSYAYRERIVDVLEEELGATAGVLGARFREAMQDYLVDHPSKSWTLDRVGVSLPQWLEARASGPDARRWQVAADVVRVERAMDAVWDAPHRAAVPYEALAAVPLEDWGDARLVPIPALCLLTVGYPVMKVMSAVLRGETIADVDLPSPRPSHVAVYASSDRRWRLGLTRAQHRLLAELVAGEALGDALAAVCSLPGTDPAALLGALGGWFEQWMGSGLFAAVQLPSEPPQSDWPQP